MDQNASNEGYINQLNEVGISVRGSKEGFKNRISKFRLPTKLADKINC